MTAHPRPLVELSGISVNYDVRGSFADRLTGRSRGAVQALADIDLEIGEGETVGIVGESGSGKTTLARTILHLVEPASGSLRLAGEEITALSEREFRPLRRRVQMVFQDPTAALNPSMDVFTAVAHPLRIHRLEPDRALRARRVYEMLERVGLAPAARFARKLPRELSGGQRQRVVIARALIVGPELLIADEPVSMLDMSVRAQIIELLVSLKNELGLTFLYITHDLATARFFCDRIAVMYLGRIVEEAPTAELFGRPRHPYTRALLDAVPTPDVIGIRRPPLQGEIADGAALPRGCPFHPRCPAAFAICGWEPKDLRTALERRWTGIDLERYANERRAFRRLDDLERSATVARIDVAHTHGTREIEAVLDALRRESPAERVWHGIEEIAVRDGAVEVHFSESRVPVLTETDGARVACHLYDEAAPASARDHEAEPP